MRKTNYIAIVIAMITSGLVNEFVRDIIQKPERIERLGMVFLSILVAITVYILSDKILMRLKK